MSTAEDHSTDAEVYNPKKDYTHTAESQQAFQDGVDALKTHLETDIFNPETSMLTAPTKDTLTLEQVRQMFFVKELKALRDTTLWQSDKHLTTPQQEAMENRQVRVNAAVNNDLVDVIADVIADSYTQTPTDLPFIRALLTQRDSGVAGKTYDLSLYGGYRGANLAPNTMTGRYVQGQFVDRVSLTYPDGTRVRKLFFKNPLKAGPIDAVTPPVLRTK